MLNKSLMRFHTVVVETPAKPHFSKAQEKCCKTRCGIMISVKSHLCSSALMLWKGKEYIYTPSNFLRLADARGLTRSVSSLWDVTWQALSSRTCTGSLVPWRSWLQVDDQFLFTAKIWLGNHLAMAGDSFGFCWKTGGCSTNVL